MFKGFTKQAILLSVSVIPPSVDSIWNNWLTNWQHALSTLCFPNTLNQKFAFIDKGLDGATAMDNLMSYEIAHFGATFIDSVFIKSHLKC